MTVLGALWLSTSIAFAVLAVLAANRQGESARRYWTLMLVTASLSAVAILVLSQIDRRADDAFCYTAAAVALVAVALSAIGWLRRAKITGPVLAGGSFGLFVTAQIARNAFGLSGSTEATGRSPL